MKFDKIYNKVLTKILDEVSAVAGVGGYAGPLKFEEEEIKEEEQEEVNSNKIKKNKD